MRYLAFRHLAQATLIPALMVAAPAYAAKDSPAAEHTVAETSAENAPETYGITVKTENHTLGYNYPKTLAREPALSAYLLGKGHEALMKFSADSDRDHAEAAARTENPFKLNPYEYQVEWSEVAEIPAYISLARHHYEYLGGAHGMSVTTSLLWDKTADKPVEALSLFTDAARLDQAMQKAFCAQLNVQRAEKRGHPVPANSDDNFEQCLTPSENTVILGSANSGSFDTISINVAPYGAGPYVEGAYQVDLLVTKALIRAVKPEYRSYFSVR